MIIGEITDKQQWENFILKQKPNTFLQSWNWGEFNQAMGDPVGQANGAGKIFRLGIFDPSAYSGQADEELIGVALVIIVDAKRGKFLFCPHGPILSLKAKNQNQKFFELFFDCLKELAKKEKADFIRISPLLENTPENLEIFRNYEFRDAPVHMMHPELSWLLDISRSGEEILAGMRKTTRNLIRRAEKEKVEVVESKAKKDIDRFYALHEATVGRHGFVPFSKNYLEREFNAFSRDNEISVFFASHGGRMLSAAIMVYYSDSAFYHHGASLASKIPASYLLIWKAIEAARIRGCRFFNFWGIAPEKKPNHPWAGLTLFKKGFGGREEAYLHAQDLAISGKYWFNWLIESARRWKRGY